MELNLVLGRAGELATTTNKLTYSLIKKIFEHNSPYRKVLYQFKVGNLNVAQDFVVYKEGKVYSDIDVENKVLWNSCALKLLKTSENSAEIKYNPLAFLNTFRFIQKALNDANLVSNFKKTLKTVDSKYSNYCEFVQNSFLYSPDFSIQAFLNAYENVVYVTYLYELFFELNNHKKIVNKPQEISNYVKQNDYLVSNDYSYFEQNFSTNFYLGHDREEIASQNKILSMDLPFIPDKVLNFNGLLTKKQQYLAAEAKLQCLKDNMRLKTGALLYLLNKRIKNKAEQKGIENFGDYELNQLL